MVNALKVNKSKKILCLAIVFAILLGTCFYQNVFLFAVNAERKTIIEFSEDFSGSDSYTDISGQKLPDGWTPALTYNNITYQDGMLIIPACGWGSNAIISPINLDYLNDDGTVNGAAEFEFSADLTVLSQTSNNSHSFGLFFNRGGKAVNSLIYPYANKVSIAENSFAIDTGLVINQTSNLKLTYKDGMLNYYLDDICLASVVWQGVLNGNFGIYTYGLKVSVDNVAITVYEDDTPLTDYSVDLYVPETGIVNPPAVVYQAEKDNIFTVISADKRPSVAEIMLDSELCVYDVAGEKISNNLSEYIVESYKTLVPMFRVNDAETVEALSDFIRENQVLDALVVSSDIELLKSALTSATALRGVFDASSINVNMDNADIWSQVVKKAINSKANTVIMPLEALNSETIRYIQKYSISVWAEVGYDNTESDIYSLVTSGVNGLISKNFLQSFNVIESFTEPINMQSPIIYGHRCGISGAPENSLHRAMLAYDAGADGVEIDIIRSADGKLIVSHDQTTEKLFTENLNIQNSTWEQLSKLSYKNPTEFATRINCLDDYFDAFINGGYFYNSDFIICVEMKFYSDAQMQSLVELIDKYRGYDIERHIVLRQTSGNAGLILARNMLPNINCDFAFLSGEFSTQAVMNGVTQYSKAIVVPYLGEISAETVQKYQSRGSMLSAWGLYNAGNHTTAEKLGINSVTTDVVALTSNYIVDIQTNDIYLEPNLDNTASFEVKLLHQNGDVSKTSDFDISVLEGDLSFVKNSDGSFTVLGDSESAVIAVKTNTTYGNKYPKYSRTFTIYYGAQKSDNAQDIIDRLTNVNVFNCQDILADYEKLSDYDKIIVGDRIHDLQNKYSPIINDADICTKDKLFGQLSFNVSNPSEIEADINKDGYYVSEIGVVIIPEQLLGSEDFVLDNTKISSSYLVAKKEFSSGDIIADYVDYTPVLRNSSDYTFVKFAVRAYVVYSNGNDEVTYYSVNDNQKKNVNNGTLVCSRNECVRLLAQHYLDNGFTTQKIGPENNLRISWSFESVWQYLCEAYEHSISTIIPLKDAIVE